MKTLFVMLLVMMLVGCSDPLILLPGGLLSGETRAAPVQWSDVPETIQVETRPSDPYSINIWGVGIGQNLYIATGSDGTTWTEFIDDNPNVRARLGTSIYELAATLVNDKAELEAVGETYVVKYDLDREDNWVSEAMVYRLDRRTEVQ
jgi:hypothetical protein